ncbi:MAG: hypothetical protein ABL921_16830 [Pirellula sp.]
MFRRANGQQLIGTCLVWVVAIAFQCFVSNQQAAASCGDYLHHGNETQKFSEAGKDLPKSLPSTRCANGQCKALPMAPSVPIGGNRMDRVRDHLSEVKFSEAETDSTQQKFSRSVDDHLPQEPFLEVLLPPPRFR